MSATRWFGAAGLCALGVGVAVLSGPPAPTEAGLPSAFKNYAETVSVRSGDREIKASFEMVAVPGGEYEMGSSDDDRDRGPDEGPQVKVRLKPFWIGKCEVTWDEFDLYFNHGNHNLKTEHEPARESDRKGDPADAVSKPTRPYVDETYGFNRNAHPAICMTHHAAMKYCEWLSKKTGKDYRLPTEAEWEYACRAGTTTPFAIPPGAPLGRWAWYKANSTNAQGRLCPHPAGTRNANGFGLHDMHGNLMEWCLDHYVKNAHELFARKAGKDGFVLSPVVRPTEKKWSHVVRGGHYKDDPRDLRSGARRASSRDWMKADPQEPQSIWWLTNLPMIGFRVCRPLQPDELTGITSKVKKENDETFELAK